MLVESDGLEKIKKSIYQTLVHVLINVILICLVLSSYFIVQRLQLGKIQKTVRNMVLWKQLSQSVWKKILGIMFIWYFNLNEKLAT